MVKTKKHSEDLRKRVIAFHYKGEGYDKISKRLSLPKYTVQAIVQKFKLQGHVMNLHGRGRKKLLSSRAARKIVRRINQNPRMTDGEIVKEQSSSGVNVSRHIFGRVLKRAGSKACLTRKTPLLKPVHLKARLEFSKSYIDKDAAFCKQDLYRCSLFETSSMIR